MEKQLQVWALYSTGNVYNLVHVIDETISFLKINTTAYARE